MVIVLEKLTRKPGQTLYCNCELERCEEHSSVCPNPATVLAEIYGIRVCCRTYSTIKVQLCSECLKNNKENK